MRMLMGLRSIIAAAFIGTVASSAQDLHVLVSSDTKDLAAGNNVFPTIQMALDHSPELGVSGRLYLEIAPGIYHERVIVTPNRARTTMIGMGRPGDVVITASQNAESAGGTFFSSTVEIYGAAFEADNITFENAAGNFGQAVAITVWSDRSVFKRCRFIGDQDTLFADFGRQYYVNSYIEGGVDFIFGNAAAVFEDSEIHIIRPGYLTAQSRTSPDEATGYVFVHVKVTAADFGSNHFYLGRPWRPFSRVVFLSSEMPESLSPQGWSPWSKGGSIQDTFYAEFNSRGGRDQTQSRLEGSRQLTSKEAAIFLPKHFLRGSDHWNPIEEAAKLP